MRLTWRLSNLVTLVCAIFEIRDKSHAKSAAVDVTLSNIVPRVMNLPNVQLAGGALYFSRCKRAWGLISFLIEPDCPIMRRAAGDATASGPHHAVSTRDGSSVRYKVYPECREQEESRMLEGLRRRQTAN